MKRWILIALGLVAFLGGWSVLLWQSVVTVEPGQQAVVERSGSVEVLEPGLHFLSPFGGTFSVYDVFFERQHEVAQSLIVEGCSVALLLTYNVGDVLAFDEAGGDYGVISAQDDDVLALARAADLSLQRPMSEALAALRDQIQEITPAGLQILRVSADVRDCPNGTVVPEPAPAPEVVQEEMVLMQSDAPLGSDRVEIYDLMLLTRDDARMTLSGAVATFDVVDAVRAEQCFGNFEDMAGLQVERVVSAGMREVAGSLARVDVPEAFASLSVPRFERMEADCGLRISPMDFSAATLVWLRATR